MQLSLLNAHSSSAAAASGPEVSTGSEEGQKGANFTEFIHQEQIFIRLWRR